MSVTLLKGSISLESYSQRIAPTDMLPTGKLTPVLLGLYGEIGSILSAAKKLYREKNAFLKYRLVVEEEFGDAFWYFTILCGRLGYDLDSIFVKTTNKDEFSALLAATDQIDAPLSKICLVTISPEEDLALLDLGKATAALFGLNHSNSDALNLLVAFADAFIHAIKFSQISFASALQLNIDKVIGRFSKPDLATLPLFDDKFDEDEQLPSEFEIRITQRKSGQSYIQWKGVYIGDPLTDSIQDPDGYRFHDVFHFAFASILHWSPVFRGLIKHKRKSNPKVDEAEDGGRATVIEEGLSAWIFSQAKMLNYFEGHSDISFDMLKTIQQFVQGYEVSKCPLSLWEKAILEGYSVFREVRANSGGIVIGCRQSRSLRYMKLEKN